MSVKDPRVAEALQRISETGTDGKPTEAALTAQRIKAYLDSVSQLRTDLAAATKQIEVLELRVQTIENQLEQRAARKAELVRDAQDMAVRAALTHSSGSAAAMRKQALDRKSQIAEFEKHFEEDGQRLKDVKAMLAGKQEEARRIRELIVKRLNMVNSLVGSPASELPARSASTSRAAQAAQSVATARGPRPARRVRRVRRR